MLLAEISYIEQQVKSKCGPSRIYEYKFRTVLAGPR